MPGRLYTSANGLDERVSLLDAMPGTRGYVALRNPGLRIFTVALRPLLPARSPLYNIHGET